MNDENFDKILGDKLNAADTDFSFTEAHWDKMEKQIVVANTDRKQRWLWTLLSLLLLPLLALLGWNSWTLHRAENTIDSLVQEVKALRQEKQTPSVFMPSTAHLTLPDNQTITKSDTVYHHIVVKRYDTIFQTVVRRELSNVQSPQSENVVVKTRKVDTTVSKSVLTSKTQTNSIVTTTKTVENAVVPQVEMDKKVEVSMTKIDVDKVDLAIKTDSIQQSTPLSILTEKTVKTDSIQQSTPLSILTEKTVKTDSIQQSTPLSILTEKRVKTDDISEKEIEKTPEAPTETGIEKAQNKQKTKRLPILKPIKMTGFELGATGGVAFIRGENILRQSGFTVGGRGALLLGERWKVAGEAQFVSLSFESDKLTGKNDIPTITPPTPDAEFQEVKVTQPYWHFTLGVQYALTRGTRLQPYIGVSALGQLKLEETFTYQFKNKLTGDDEIVKTVRNEANFHLPYLRLNAGATYPIFRKFSAQVEGSYDVNIDNHRTFKPLWQVKGGVFYRF